MAKARKSGKYFLPSSVGMAATSGIAWVMVQTVCGKASVFIGQLILAKILAPEDFGVLGLAFTIAAFFGLLSNIGIGQVLQQRQSKLHLWATQAFGMTLGISTLTAIALAIYAPIGAALYHNDKIIGVIWVLAVNLPVAALSTVPQARLQSQLRFNFLSSYGSAELIISQILTIGLAWKGFGALSFVLPLPLLSVIRAIVYWRAAPVPLRAVRRSRGWGVMLKRSSGVFGAALLVTAIGQGDYATLGLLTSAQIVGIYYFAFKLSAQPMLTLAMSFTNVLRPALVALKNDRARQLDAAVKTASLLGLLTVPLCYLQIAIARPALLLLFGSRWIDSIPLIQILSIGLPLDAISWAAGSLLEARGQYGKSFKYQLISAPFFFILVGAGALLGSSFGVAIGVSIYYTLHPLFFTFVVFSREGIGVRKILSLFYVPFLLGCASIGGGYLISQAPVFQGMLLAQIIVTTFVGGAAYVLAVRYIVPLIYNEVRTKLRQLMKKKVFVPQLEQIPFE